MVIFDNYDLDFFREYALECLDKKDISDDDIYMEEMRICEDEWDFYTQCIEKHLNKHTCIATGSVGLWNGRHEGYSIIENMNDFWNLLKDCWYYQLDEQEDRLDIKCSHHDGTNHYSLYNYDNETQTPLTIEWCL